MVSALDSITLGQLKIRIIIHNGIAVVVVVVVVVVAVVVVVVVIVVVVGIAAAEDSCYVVPQVDRMEDSHIYANNSKKTFLYFCLSIDLTTYLSIHLCTYQSIYVFIFAYTYTYLSIFYRSHDLSTYQALCLSILFIYLFIISCFFFSLLCQHSHDVCFLGVFIYRPIKEI